MPDQVRFAQFAPQFKEIFEAGERALVTMAAQGRAPRWVGSADGVLLWPDEEIQAWLRLQAASHASSDDPALWRLQRINGRAPRS